MTARLGAVLASVLLAATASAAPRAIAAAGQGGAAPVQLHVLAAEELGAIRRELVGFGWHRWSDDVAPLSAVEDLSPHLIRIDASLQDVSTLGGGAAEPRVAARQGRRGARARR